VRALWQSRDHWHGRNRELRGRDEPIDSRVRGGRNCRGLGYMNCGVLGICLSLNIQEESEGGPKEGLEESGRDTSFKEGPKLSQHEKLQDLEPHGSKTV